MKFEVVNKDGQVAMWTTEVECVPTQDELNMITSAGYRCKVDGKVVSKSRVMETVKAVGGTASTASVVSPKSSSRSRSRQVKCVETGEVYLNCTEAAKAIGASESSIYYSIKHGTPIKKLTFVAVL